MPIFKSNINQIERVMLLNKVDLIGYVASKPIQKNVMVNGIQKQTATFTLYVDDGKSSVPCQIWEAGVKACLEHCNVGMLVAISGKLDAKTNGCFHVNAYSVEILEWAIDKFYSKLTRIEEAV